MANQLAPRRGQDRNLIFEGRGFGGRQEKSSLFDITKKFTKTSALPAYRHRTEMYVFSVMPMSWEVIEAKGIVGFFGLKMK